MELLVAEDKWLMHMSIDTRVPEEMASTIRANSTAAAKDTFKQCAAVIGVRQHPNGKLRHVTP